MSRNLARTLLDSAIVQRRQMTIAVAVAAIGVRLWGIGEWSLWEDEETTIFFSQNPDKWFPRSFPLFFLTLRGLFHLVGISEAAGRLVAATFGFLSIVLVFRTTEKHVSRSCAVVAAALLAVNLGHVFWSQSVRDYTAATFFQALSMLLFLDGFEKRSYTRIALSNAALLGALLSHFSAILLAPVHVGYLILTALRREKEGAYRFRGYSVFVITLLPVLAFFVSRIMMVEGRMSSWPIASARDPIHIAKSVFAYFGGPLLALALVGYFFRGHWPRRVTIYFAVAAGIPVLEIAVIAAMDRVNVTWYYALFALHGFAVLAAITLVQLWETGRQRAARWLGGATAVYSLVLLALYFTVLHGDRPRWRDATLHLKAAAAIDLQSTDGPEIFASVPGCVAYYLEIPPGETMTTDLVHDFPMMPPVLPPSREQWFVVRDSNVAPSFRRWFHVHCEESARFEAGLPGMDRTVVVYRYDGNGKRHAGESAAEPGLGLEFGDGG